VIIIERKKRDDVSSLLLHSIAIGEKAGRTDQMDNSIILNGTGIDLNAPNSGFYVKPIRDEDDPLAELKVLLYNQTTGEIVSISLSQLMNLLTSE
jgi:hypothetical protein